MGNVSGSAGAKVQVGASPGLINVTGDWNNTGIGISLELDNLGTSIVPGVQFDQLNVSGQFTHGGTVTIDRSELVGPSTTQQLKLIGWGTEAGLSTSTVVSFLGGSPLVYNFQADGLYVTVQASAGTPGDYNNNGVVDVADYVVWRENEGTNNPLSNNSLPGPIGQAALQPVAGQLRQAARQRSGHSPMRPPMFPSPLLGSCGLLRSLPWRFVGEVLGVNGQDTHATQTANRQT